MSGSGLRRRTVLQIIIALLVLLAASGIAEYFMHRARSNAVSVKEYHEDVASDWGKTVERSESVNAAFTGVVSPDDLGSVASAAGLMREELQGILDAREKTPPPSGERNLAGAETGYLTSLDRYLEMVEELASGGDEDSIAEDRALLESRAAQALSKVNDFLFNAEFIGDQISGEFFKAGESLANAFAPPEWQSAEEEVAYGIVNSFMDADIKEFNPDVLWSLSSSKRIEGLRLMGVTRENFAEGWIDARGDEKHPVDFHVSRRGIVFTPSTVEVEVVVYLERGAPWRETVRLVREADGWKVEGYPYVGWL